MEYWELKTDDGRILFSAPCHPYKKDLNPPNPVFLPREIFFRISPGPSFQYSIIPSRCKRDLGHSHSSLTWPKEPGFQCLDKKFQ